MLDAGYVRICLDYFALPGDGLAVARQVDRLKCKTNDSADTFIALGTIGRMPQGIVQNVVPSGDYPARIAEDQLAAAMGYALTGKHRFRADIIVAFLKQN